MHICYFIPDYKCRFLENSSKKKAHNFLLERYVQRKFKNKMLPNIPENETARAMLLTDLILASSKLIKNAFPILLEASTKNTPLWLFLSKTKTKAMTLL